MVIDLRTYTMVPGRLGAWLKLYEAEGMPIHVRHLGQPIGVFTTDVGTVNQVVFLWGFESQGDRERRREALEADPDCRVGGDVASPTPHRPGRADFPHPVLHERVSLALA